jgi:hypothetical protein
LHNLQFADECGKALDTKVSTVRMQDYDRQLQRALNYEDFDLATELRQRREQLTEAVADFQVAVEYLTMHLQRSCAFP